MTDKLYYFAHPYSAISMKEPRKEEEENYFLCVQRSARLIEMGYNIFSPIAHSHPIERAMDESKKVEGQFWMDLDFNIIHRDTFDGIIMGPKWQSSKGCNEEYEWFRDNKRWDGQYHEILFYDDLFIENEFKKY